VAPDGVAFEGAMRAVGMLGQPSEALALLDAMRLAGSPPSLGAYHDALGACVLARAAAAAPAPRRGGGPGALDDQSTTQYPQ
jgi:hypothetical protein